MKILVDRDIIEDCLKVFNDEEIYVGFVNRKRINPLCNTLSSLLRENPIAMEDIEPCCLVTKDECGRVTVAGSGVSNKAWPSPLPEMQAIGEALAKASGKVTNNIAECSPDSNLVTDEKMTDRQAIIELLEMLIQNEKRKNVGLGANITTLLQSELADLKDKLMGEK